MITDHSNMPTLFDDIIHSIVPVESNVAVLYSEWEQFLSSLEHDLPWVTIKDDGDTVCVGHLSPGCQLCKSGEWDCLFVTSECNLDCRFCISPFQNHSIPLSALGRDVQELMLNYRKAGIRGSSFSGGEPFVRFDELLNWLCVLKKEFPDNYCWIYTNAVLASEEKIDRLADSGLHEIRVNTAATGYNHPDIMRILEYSANRLQVTVEIPLIRKDYELLRSALKDYTSAGMTYPNVHELMRECNTPSRNLNDEMFTPFIFPDGHETAVSADSREIVQDMLRFLSDPNLSCNLNFCSTVNKLRQLRKRRENMMPFISSHFKPTGSDCLETVFLFRNQNDYQWLHPDIWNKHKSQFGDYQAYRLRKMIPLSLWDPGRYISAIRIED